MSLLSRFPRLSLRHHRAVHGRGATIRSQLHRVAGRALPAVLIALVLGVWGIGSSAARRSYSYNEDPIRAGTKALDEMRLSDAKAKFEEALENNYQTPKAKFGLGEVMLRSGRLEEAERLYREALDAQTREGGKDLPEAHASLGLLLIDSDRWEEGAEQIHTAYRQDPDYWPAAYGEARLLLHDRKWDDAERLLNKGAKRKGVPEGEDLFHHGWALLYLGTNELASAETEALAAFHMNPSNPTHGKLVAQVYERRNVPALAIAACEEVLQTPGITPTASFVHFMGTLYQKAGRYNEARDRYLQAVDIDSTYAPVLKDLAGLLFMAKQYDTSAQIYLRYVEREPHDIDAWVGLAGSLDDGGRQAQALGAAGKAMELDSTRSDVQIAYARVAIRNRDRLIRDRAARIYGSLRDSAELKTKDRVLLASYQIETNQLETARRNLGDVVATDSSSAEAYFQLGLLSLKTSSADSAIDYFDRAIRLDPKVPLYHLNAGVAHFQLKDFKEAIRACRRSVELDPRLVIGHTLLGQALIAADSLSAAEAQYKKAVDIDPKNGTALRGIGYCSLKRSAYQEAVDAYKSATETDPRNGDGWVGLGQAYLGLGNVTAATGALRQAQTVDPNNASLNASWELLNRARQ